MKCTQCATENPDNARFCGICGKPFADSAASDAEFNTSIPDAVTDGAEERPSEENTTDDVSARSYAVSSLYETPPEALPNENSSVDRGEQRTSIPSAPAPLPRTPNDSVPSDSGFGAVFAPVGNAAPPSKPNAAKRKKEKKVVSLSVAVLCIIAVFVLSVICGVLTQLYTRKIKSSANSGTVYSSYQASNEAGISCEYVNPTGKDGN